jgi:hypothetical protein
MSGSNGGPSDDKDARIKELEALLAASKGQAVPQTGPSASKALRKEREAAAAKIFGKFGRR